MIITQPIGDLPRDQSLSGGLPAAALDRLLAARQTSDLTPERNYPRDLMLAAGAGESLQINFNASTALTDWDGRTREGAQLVSESAGTSGRILALTTESRISGFGAVAGELAAGDWVSVERIVAVIHPALAVDGRLAIPSRSRRSITGRTHRVELSADPVFEVEIELNGHPDWGLARDLAACERLDSVRVWPCGLETRFATSEERPAWRAFGFARDCAATRFTGWRGRDGLDSGGASGRLVLAETI